MDFNTSIKEILEDLESTICHDVEDLVYRMGLKDDEFMDVFDIKHNPSEITGYTLPVGIYEITDINKTLEYLLPDFVKKVIRLMILG